MAKLLISSVIGSLIEIVFIFLKISIKNSEEFIYLRKPIIIIW